MRNANMTRTILWILVAAYAVALIANISFGLSIPIALVLLVSSRSRLFTGRCATAGAASRPSLSSVSW